MKGFDILRVRSAVKTRNKMDLQRTHLTTMQFGEIVPLFVEESVPGDDFNVNGIYFSRLAPLVKPTYGKFQFKTVAGYVPYHMIANDSEAWLAGKTTWEGTTPRQRVVTVGALHYFIKGYITTNSATAQNADYIYIDSNGSTVYTRFNKQGKYFVKILNSLGYNLPSKVDEQATSYWYNTLSPKPLSAYPLLAFFKFYNDYLSQSQRYNTSQLSNILNAVKYQRTIAGYTPSTGQITSALLTSLFSSLRLCYENDYFTSAWQSPNNPLSSVENVAGIKVPGVDPGNAISGNIEDTIYANSIRGNNPGSTLSTISQRAIDFLKSFDNWVRRNNYSGSRAVQQVYSRMGIKTSDYREHYAKVINVESMPIQVGDVTAMADSNGVILGDYSGKGIMSGSKPFSVKCDDYGLVLVLGFFTVTPMNSYGYDRRVLRTSPLDYYNPEFDGLGADSISVGEYFGSPIDESGSAVEDDAVFGFTERYNSYRFARDVISGEFRTYRRDGDMACWHTGRNLSDVRDNGQLVAQNSAVVTMPQTDSEFNRIFSVSDSSVDHFYLTAKFDVSAVRPMLSLNQVVDLGEGDTVVPRNGNEIS